MSHRLSRLALAAGLLTLVAGAASAQTPYKVVDRWKLGGTDSWDYLSVDTAAHQLFIAHGTRIEVVDTATGKLDGEIKGLNHTHGVAFEPSGEHGFLSDGGANSVVVFDRKSLAIVKKIPVGTNPDCILYEPATGTVWAFNGRSSDVSVIDPATLAVVATIKSAGKLEFAVADGKGNVYENAENTSSVLHYDARTRTLADTWKLSGCEGPAGLAIDAARGRLFSTCDGKMAILDAASGKQLGLANIGDGPDAAGFSPKYDLAFASNGDGSLSVVDAAKGYATIETLKTQKGARTMTYDPSTDRIYTVAAMYGPTPAPTAAVPHPKPGVLPESFTVLVIGRH